MLAPATPSPTNGARGEGEGTGRSRPDTSTGGTASAPSRPGTTSGAAEEEAGSAAAASRARTSEPEAGATSGRTRTVSAAAAAVPEGEAAASAGEASGAGDARGGDEPPSGHPKKPLLAAAGIAGAVLLVVPLLIWATDDSEKKDKVAAAGSDTVLGDDSLAVPKGDYAPAEPTPEPTSPKPSAKVKAKAKQPSPVPTPEPPPKQQQKKKSDSGAGQVKQEAPKAPPNTAALAVQRLATASPGRHICYRAYMTGTGWQAPVCDGATAGLEGQGRAIKALNIAVSDTNGVDASPFFQGAGWTVPWKGVGNGSDLVIGNAKQSAPNMGGFAINVGKDRGNICQNTQVSGSGWLGLGCDNPQTANNYIFGGDVTKERALEAVKFTV
ncbi:hypothetical protein O1Q96_21370 [Streptomyces sp. Qhu-G9]|uniref:hypothetical protein n=1 Tax=Streptomyces sp. Qhu-G9 TaxID=3452799 RepID=UPI0022AC8252|nr:hypothetical protein [Streptomyces aurantiacus]WAU82102.1 hypothetical protein O1Q96_21370 [Streptomyces aurantiacus]